MNKPIKPQKTRRVVAFPYRRKGELRISENENGGITNEILTYSLICDIRKLISSEIKDFEIYYDDYYTQGALSIVYNELNLNYEEELEEYNKQIIEYKNHLVEKKKKSPEEKKKERLKRKIQDLENQLTSLKAEL